MILSSQGTLLMFVYKNLADRQNTDSSEVERNRIK